MFANIDPYILAFSALTVIVTIWMGFRSARTSKTASDFFVAGRSVSVGWNASAISGEYLSAASFMGVAGMVMSSGYDALWYPVCYACGYLFLLLFIAGPLRRFGAYTIPDFAEGRFDSPMFRKIAVVFVLFIGFFYTMPQMKGAGTTLAYIFPGLPYWVGVVLVGAVITLNVALGGMKGITLVQAFQYWAKMFAISVPIFVLMTVYGHYGKQIGKNESGPGFALMAGAEYRAAYTPQTNQMPVASWKQRVLAMLPKNYSRKMSQTEANRLGLGQTTGTMLSSPTIQLHGLLSIYGSATSKTILIAGVSPQDGVERRLAYTTNHVFGSEMLGIIVEVLRTNGVVLVSEDTREVRFAATNVLMSTSSVHTTLPAKAPSDATWLNPFGPLTTKAAKAAKPLTIYDGPLLINRFGSTIGHSLQRLFEKISGGKNFTFDPEKAYSFSPTNRSAFELVLTSTMERQFTRRISEIRYGPELTNLFISWPSEMRLIKAKDFAREMHPVLKNSGVTVVDEGEVVTAFLTKDAKVVPINPKPYALLYTYSLIIALVCGTAGLPHILVRFYTNPDGVAAKRTTMWVMILIGVFYVFPPVFGVMGRNLLPSLYEGVGAKGTDKVVLELPRILNDSSTPNSQSSILNSQSAAAGSTNTALRNENLELRNAPVKKRGIPWGSILSGITCAGAFAAFMSTFSGLLVSMTGAMAHDVYGRMLNPKATPEQRLRAFKIAAVVIGGVAILLGSQVEPLEINFMVGQAFAIAAASYFPLLFMAVWWRKLTMKGAATGMLTGGLSALIGISLTSFSTLAIAPGRTGELFALFKPLNDFWAAHPLLRILCEQPAIWAVPLAIVLMVIVSKLTSKDVPEDIRMKMLVLHAPEKLGLKQEYIQEHQQGH